MKDTQFCSLQAVGLSVATAAAAETIVVGSVRAGLLQTFAGAAALCALAALAALVWQSSRLPQTAKTMLRLLLAVWLAAEVCRTVVQAQQVCTQAFSSMALLGLLPLLLWAGFRLAPQQWHSPAQVLWWFAVLGCAVCLLGLAHRMHWYRLLEPGSMTLRWQVPVYAEYAALPLLCAPHDMRKGTRLPLLVFAVQGGAMLCQTLVFGSRDYPAAELLRAWRMQAFSRMDALLLLIWLTCAIFRICFLCTAIRLVQPLGQKRAKGRIRE